MKEIRIVVTFPQRSPSLWGIWDRGTDGPVLENRLSKTSPDLQSPLKLQINPHWETTNEMLCLNPVKVGKYGCVHKVWYIPQNHPKSSLLPLIVPLEIPPLGTGKSPCHSSQRATTLHNLRSRGAKVFDEKQPWEQPWQIFQ
jgi:hypothetical protein